ncbi:acyltransferase [Methylobacterium sp. J-076]|uniref:acyltransferase n=1 Tax=Methylobacterium sp. J-076 TaxID=2836655 RepID=UPI001FBAE3A6|nr:acyltransferase [Methylobacterium sp. J-076]MCJ2012613.1 acyltransferase [Methylobacterium sp. J-076]
MSDFFHRSFDYILSSELIPVFLRMKVMRMRGYNFTSDACIWAHHIIKSKQMSLGRESFINIGFFYDGAGDLDIGDRVRIGQFVRVLTATHEIGPSEQRCTMQAVVKPVSIEDGCWVGANVTILPGVVVRKGCVIGANSLVTRSTDENCLYVGNPARRIRRIKDGGEVVALPVEAGSLVPILPRVARA